LLKDSGTIIRKIYSKTLLSSIIALLFSVIGQMANHLFAGNVFGISGLATLGLILPIYYIFATAGNMIGIGAVAVCSSYIGLGKDKECRQTVTVSYLLSLFFYAALTLISLLFLKQIVTLMGASSELYNDVYRYSFILILGGIFIIGTYLSFNFLRLDGKNILFPILFFIMAVLNIALNFVFTTILNIGVHAIAISFIISSAFISISGFISLKFKGNSLKPEKINYSDFIKISKKIIKIGSPGAAENISILLRVLFLNIFILSTFGKVALSTFSVIGSINISVASVIAAIAGTLVPFMGVFIEEKDIRSIRQLLRYSLFQGFMWTAPCMIICIAFSKNIAIMFGMSSEIVYVIPAIILFSLSFIPSLISNIIICINLTNGHTMLANILSILKNFLFVAFCVLALSNAFGTVGLWSSFFAAEILVIITAMLAHFIISQKNKQLSAITLLNHEVLESGKYTAFSVKSNTKDIMSSIEKINDFCEQNELNPKSTMLISLALEEMLISVSDHSFPKGAEGEISIRILLHKKDIILRIRNLGERFNPIKYYEDKSILKQDSEELEFDDSLGIKMIIATSKSVIYRRTFGINNLTIVC
jgi:Na+-driven multidrug efflux pump